MTSALTAVAESAVKPLIEPDLVARIHLYLSKVLEDGEPLLQSCSTTLAMSERTLQRRLTLLGTSFAQVLDAHRHQAALAYLRERRIDRQQMAFLLGVVYANSYFRACKRWTQTTPKQYRRTLLR